MTDMVEIRRCPVHAAPDADVLEAWSCPDDCQDWLAELERRIDEVTVMGNFVRVKFRMGVMFRLRYENHKPVGKWKATRFNSDRLRIRRMHAARRRR